MLAYHAQSTLIDGSCFAFAHAIGEKVGSDISVELFRKTEDVLGFFKEKYTSLSEKKEKETCLVSDLGICMFAISELFKTYDCRVLSKGSKAPISITLMNSSSPVIVFLDAKGLFDFSFSATGIDYSISATVDTNLSNREIDSIKNVIYEIYGCLEMLKTECPFVKEERIGINIVTRTSVVREWQKENLRKLKSKKAKRSVGDYWLFQARREKPKTDDELNTYLACSRGGLAFVGSEHASKPYSLNCGFFVKSYDAVSQYPAQIVSHRFPQGFTPCDKAELDCMFELVKSRKLNDVLDRFDEPFNCAFDGFFEFENIRIKENTPFSENGIATLQWSRFNEHMFVDKDGDMEFTTIYTNELRYEGYKDRCINPVVSFGKLVKADKCCVWLTEVEAWILCQVYDFDSFSSICGYGTLSFTRPTDMSVLSVMGLFKNKAKAKGTVLYERAKKDLNSLYGIESTNEARPESYMCDDGINIGASNGVQDLPRNPKAWYQMGQRVSAYGRMAQIINIMLVSPYTNGIVCGDTDSLKIIAHESNSDLIEEAFALYGKALTKAKLAVCKRVFDFFKNSELIDELNGIGYYREEYRTNEFCAGWNKAYIYRKSDKSIKVTIAGIATRNNSGIGEAYEDLANELDRRYSFQEVCGLILGYNVSIDKKISNSYTIEYPKFGDMVSIEVKDRDGNERHVLENAMPVMKPVGFTINATIDDNIKKDMEKAFGNNPLLNKESVYVFWEPGEKPHIGRFDDFIGMYTEVL